MTRRVGSVVLWAALAALVGCVGPEAEQARQETAQVHYDVGVGALAENNLSKAIGELQIAVRDDPQNARNHHALGSAYLRNLQTDAAIVAFRRAVELNPRLSDAYNDLGAGYMRQQQWDLAIDAFRKALANPQYLNPERAHLNLGNVYYLRKQYDLSAAEFRRLQDVLPQSPDGYFFLGRTLLAQGKLQDARQQLEKAIKIDGTIPIFHVQLGLILVQSGRPAEAQESFRRAVNLNPVGPDAEEARRYLKEVK